MPRAIADVFAAPAAQQAAAPAAAPVRLLCSYMQVYNEALYDLLDEGNGDRPIEGARGGEAAAAAT